jgi:dihydrolipoamide dehydrogenase
VTGEIDVERVLWWRDQVTDGRDDSWHAGWIEDQRGELVRGEARVVGPGVVAVGEREIEHDELVVATGSVPAIPPLEGLGDIDYWTNREAIWASSIPASLIVLGGGAVGVELAQFFRRMGATSRSSRTAAISSLASMRTPGSLLAERFAQDGIRVLVETRADSVEAVVDGARLHLVR